MSVQISVGPGGHCGTTGAIAARVTLRVYLKRKTNATTVFFQAVCLFSSRALLLRILQQQTAEHRYALPLLGWPQPPALNDSELYS